MTQRQMSIRLGIDGKADIQRDMDAIAASGDAAFARLGKSIDQATAAIERQKAKQDQLAQSIANSASQAANQQKFNEVLGIGGPGASANGAPSSAAASVFSQMEQRAAALRAQIDPLATAQGKMNMAISDANALLAAGAISEAEHAAAVGLAKTAYKDAEAALKNFGAASGLGSTQTMALTAAIRHMIDATIAGRPPLQALAMEAGNLSYGLSGGGGALNAVKALGSGIGSFLLSPLGLAATAFVTVGGAALLGFSRAQEAQKQFTDGTQFAGRAAGLTRDQFESLAQSGAKAANISVNAARGIEAAFSSTGQVGQQSIGGLIDLTAEFARKTGQNMDAAGAALAGAFADPGKTGEKLLATLGGLDDKTAQLIQRYLQANDVVGAQKTLQDALIKTLKEATDQTTWYGNAWEWVKRQISAAAEAASQGFAAPKDTALLAQLKTQLAGAQADNPNGYRDATIASLKAQIAAVQARVDAAVQRANLAAADKAATDLSNAAGPLVRGAIPGFGDLETLKAQQSVIDKLLASDAALKKVGVSLADAKSAQDAYNHATSTWIDSATRAAEENRIEIASINAKTPAQKAAIAGQREELALRGQLVTKSEANARIRQAEALAYARANQAIVKYTDSLKANLQVAEAYLSGTTQGLTAELGGAKLAEQIGKTAVNGAKQIAQLRDETAARKALNDQVAAGAITTEQAAQQLSVENSLAPLRIAYDLAEGDAKKELAKIIAALAAARANDNAEATRSRALSELEDSRRNIDLLKQELTLTAAGDTQRQVELAMLQEKQRLLSQHIDLESAEGRELLANAAYAEKLKQQLDLAAASRGEIESMFDSVAGKLSDLAVNGGNFGDTMKSIFKDIQAEGLKLSLVNPLKNWIFGTNLPTSGSVGSAFSSLFGGKRDGSSAASALYVAPVAANDNLFGLLSGTRNPDGSIAGLDMTPPALLNLPADLSRTFEQSGYSLNQNISTAFSSSSGGGGFLSELGSVFDNAINWLGDLLNNIGSGGSSGGGLFDGLLNFAGGLLGGGGGGGGAAGGGSSSGGLFAGFGAAHMGGDVESLSQRKIVDIAAFRNARRYRFGGMVLGPDEIPIVAHRGERVLNPDETRAYNSRASEAQPVQIVYAPVNTYNGVGVDEVKAYVDAKDEQLRHELPSMAVSAIGVGRKRYVRGLR